MQSSIPPATATKRPRSSGSSKKGGKRGKGANPEFEAEYRALLERTQGKEQGKAFRAEEQRRAAAAVSTKRGRKRGAGGIIAAPTFV